ncbi:MAG: hypothetical protein Q7S03_04145 [bacterium]|nr:hypothetical protein [bacterium]
MARVIGFPLTLACPEGLFPPLIKIREGGASYGSSLNSSSLNVAIFAEEITPE